MAEQSVLQQRRTRVLEYAIVCHGESSPLDVFSLFINRMPQVHRARGNIYFLKRNFIWFIESHNYSRAITMQ